MLFTWSRAKGSFSLYNCSLLLSSNPNHVNYTLAVDLDAFAVSLGVKVGFFKWEFSSLFNQAWNSFEVITTRDVCKVSSPWELCFFNSTKFEFNKNNLKTHPSSNPIYLNSTSIHPNWNLPKEMKKKSILKSYRIYSCHFPEKKHSNKLKQKFAQSFN